MSHLNVRNVIAAATGITLLAGALASLLFLAIMEMRDAVNQTDDRRAVNAANAAANSMRAKLAGTIKDNAVWDDAYESINSDTAHDWAYRNWGKVSGNYPLYDGVIVQGRNGKEIAAYYRGEVFDPERLFGEPLERIYEKARADRQRTAVSFIKSNGLLFVIGANAIQPFSKSGASAPYAVLVFFKLIDEKALSKTGADFQLTGLRASPVKVPGLLEIPLLGILGSHVSYLVWPASMPGDKIVADIMIYLYVSAALLVLFFALVLVTSGREILMLRHIAKDAHQKATHDALTGLLNRRGLLERLGASACGTTLHLIDLDGFKTVNDTWGHNVGDVLLQMVAARLSSPHPDIRAVARLGGDEFAIIQSGTGASASVASAIARLLTGTFDIDGRTFEISASIGYAETPAAVPALELIRRADMALYQAKKSRRGCAHAYTAQLDTDREQTAIMEQRLREAIHEERIMPVFQPIVSARTGEIRSVEALARWEWQADRIPPDVFIPLAERSGMIDVLGMQVLVASIRAVREFSGLGLSVNISPIQLCNPDFPGQLNDLLSKEGFDGDRLTLEITEGVLISSPEQAQSAMQSLKALGVKFALDDFGSGFASIGTLRQFSFDRLKLDKSIVSDADDDRGRGVLQATIGVATALGIPVTAEGIETAQQSELLREVGCEQLQGYYFGRPTTISHLAGLLPGPIAGRAGRLGAALA